MENNGPRFVPASIQRVRCFMNNRGGLRVKPWATAGETLEAFHDMLVLQKQDEAFWKDLEALLAQMSQDVKRRIAAGGGSVIGNEVLDTARHQSLLTEIRRKLDGRRKSRGRFRALASALSAPAMGVLFILGAAVTAGCYSSSELRGDGWEDAADVAHDHDGDADAAPDPSGDGTAETMDGRVDPVVDPVPDEVACEHEGETIQEIIAECVTDDTSRAYYRQCVNALNESWKVGLKELFNCEPCNEIYQQLSDCLSWRCSDPASQGEFDAEEFLDNCSVVFYLGVRFE